MTQVKEILKKAELFQGLDKDELSSLAAIGKRRSLNAGEYLFLLGDNAESLFIVARGRMELCFPLSLGGVIKDVRIETVARGEPVGWSSLVKPYRFTFSARAPEDVEVIGFSRTDLSRVFEAVPHGGYVFTRKLCEMIGHRFLNLQALWARELQRTVASTFGSAEPSNATPVPE